jgi:site-specific DNA recombinase
MASSNRRKSPAQAKDRHLRVVTYRRISTNEENQPYSLEAQETSLGSFVASQLNYEFVGDYVDQQTGTNNKRPGLERMLADASQNKFDVVLIYRLDRLSRSVQGFMEILHHLEEQDVALRSATESFETMTPSGKMTAQMLSVFAEFEHDVLMGRILAGFATKASRGEWMGGRAPYGYSLNKELKSLSVIESEAAAVRQIFAFYLEGDGCKVVAERLNALGYRVRSGRGWDPQAVLRILNGAVYAGYIQHGDERHEGLHEAIIKRDDFEKATKLRSDRQGARDLKALSTTTSGYILTGILKCGVCGGAYVGAGSQPATKGYRYYQCALQIRRADAEKCTNERIAAEKLEEMLIGEVVKAYADTTLFERALALAMSNVPDELNSLQQEGAGIAANIKKTQGALDRYFAAFEDGSLSAQSLRERTESLTTRLEELRANARRVAEQIDELAGTNSNLADLSHVLTHASNILSSSGNYREKKRCLSGLVASVTIQPGRVVHPVLRVPTIPLLPTSKSKNGHREALLTALEEIENRRTQGDSAVSTSGTPVRMGSHLVEVLGIEPQVRQLFGDPSPSAVGR